MKKELNIQYIVSDIDGVLTDGHVVIDEDLNEQKSIFYRDLDSIRIGRGYGLEFLFMTGEDTKMSRAIGRRFGVETYHGVKDKLKGLLCFCNEKGLTPDQVCYIGDSDPDAEAIRAAGFGAAPNDAAPDARAAADYCARSSGGGGVLFEVVKHIIAAKERIYETAESGG